VASGVVRIFRPRSTSRPAAVGAAFAAAAREPNGPRPVVTFRDLRAIPPKVLQRPLILLAFIGRCAPTTATSVRELARARSPAKQPSVGQCHDTFARAEANAVPSAAKIGLHREMGQNPPFGSPRSPCRGIRRLGCPSLLTCDNTFGPTTSQASLSLSQRPMLCLCGPARTHNWACGYCG
jgi:hypothetical protein